MHDSDQHHEFFDRLDAVLPTLRERAPEIDSKGQFPHDNIKMLAELDLFGLAVPPERGGLDGGVDGNLRATFETAMRLATACTNTAQIMGVHMISGCIVSLLGDEDQKSLLHGAMVSDKELFGMWASEPGTGPIRVKLTTTATRVDGGYRISGMKHYATNSAGAGWVLLFVQREAMSLADGMILAAIPTSAEGVEIIDNWNAMGQRGTSSGSVNFNDVFVPDSHIVAGEAEFFEPKIIGSLFQSLFSSIYVGAARGALNAAVDYLTRYGRPSPGYERRIDDPVLQHQIGELEARINAAWLSVLDSVDKLQAVRAGTGKYVEASLASSMAGVVATEAATTTLNEVFRLVGSSAARRDGTESSVFELYLRNVRLLSLQDSVDTKKTNIGRALLGVAEPRPGLSS